jgi:hypothetical protein
MTQTERISDFQASLEAYHRAYGEFLAVCHHLDPALAERPGACGVWSPKQVVAHLAGWLEEAADRFSQIIADPASEKDYDVDAWNTRMVEARAELDWHATLDDLNKGAVAIGEAVASLVNSHAPSYRPFSGWLSILGDDLNEHGACLREWANRK